MEEGHLQGQVAAAALLLIASTLAGAALGRPSDPQPLLWDLPRGPAAVADVLSTIASREGIPVAPARACPTLEDALALHAVRLGVPAPRLAARVPADLDAALGCLLDAVHAANLAMDATFAGVPTSDLLPYLTGERETPPVQMLAGRDHAQNLAASVRVADAVARAIPLFTGPRGDVPDIDLWPVLRLAPHGDDLQARNYALLIDMEGDDLYTAHAAGVFAGVGLGIWDVDEESAFLYEEPGGVAHVHVAANHQDADAVLSSSVLIDLAGNDRYGVKLPPMFKDAERGCGGEDIVPWVATQGAGVIGTGQLYDLGGDNTFIGRAQTQGAGHILGVGVLYTGAGRDSFEAVRAAQGSGLLGGIGLLIDEGGDSSYTIHVPPLGVFNGDLGECDSESRYAQGSAFDRRNGPLVGSVGVLLERGGNDSYRAEKLAQGFGQGPGLGLLLDERGDDSYLAVDRAQGASQGRSRELNPQAQGGAGVGALVDRAGDDTYSVAGVGQGWALGDPLGVSPLPPDTLAFVLDRDEALGLLLDEAGEDTYAGQDGRGDGTSHVQGILGLFADVALEG